MTYLDRFNEVALSQKSMTSEINLWCPIDTAAVSTADLADQVIRRSLKVVGFTPKDLIGKCFNAITGASNALLAENIRHTVTIGDVHVKGKSYFNTSPQVIQEEMEQGFVPNAPIQAHAWITLEDGTILDLTILSSLANKEKRKIPKMIKAIFRSDEPARKDLTHIPYMLGPMFIIRTTLEPSEMSLQFAQSWAIRIDDLHQNF
ncbi:hypothetical protein [Shewanella baltica]|uniref:hypothetical protein n=1 Tax=Shewanella baltica TaxID=62322 RepID=UPI0039AF8896